MNILERGLKSQSACTYSLCEVGLEILHLRIRRLLSGDGRTLIWCVCGKATRMAQHNKNIVATFFLKLQLSKGTATTAWEAVVTDFLSKFDQKKPHKQEKKEERGKENTS